MLLRAGKRAERLLLGLCAVAIVLSLAAPGWRALHGEARDYTWAHYRVGAAFFGDLGYTGMYDAMLANDRAGHWRGPAPVELVRDLGTYGLRAPGEGVSDPALADTVAFFQPRLSPGTWRSFFRDKGYNGSPAWWATSGRVVARVPLRWIAAVGVLDVALLGGALLALALTFGLRPASLVSAWIALFYGAEQHLVGGPLQLDWIALFIGSICLIQRARPGAAGVLMGAAAMLRVFPVLLLAGPLLAAAARWHAVARVPTAWRRFAAGVVLAVGIGLALGATSPRGPAAWGEFVTKLEVHAANHHLGDRRIGLKPLLAWVPQGERTDAEARAERTARWPARAPTARALTGFLAACWVMALLASARRRPQAVRTPEDETRELIPLLLLGLALVFLVTPMSRYYMLLPALLLVRPGRRGEAASLFGIVAVVHAVRALGWPDATVYAVANLGWLALFSVVVGRSTRALSRSS